MIIVLITSLFCFLSNVLFADQILSCLNAKSASKFVVEPLPEEFVARFQYVDQIKAFSANGVVYYSKKLNKSAVFLENNGLSYEYFLNRSTMMLTFVNKSDESDIMCYVSKLSNESFGNSAIFFPNSLLKLGSVPFDLVDLYNSYFLASNLMIMDNTTSEHDHGIPVEHFLGCSKFGKYWLEFKVCVVDKNFMLNGLRDSKKLPTRIEVKIYDEIGTKSEFNSIYELFAYKTYLKPEELYQLPPQGVFCEGMPVTLPVPTLPGEFSIRVDYLDLNSKIIDEDHTYYDAESKIIASQFSHSTLDEPNTLGTLEKLQPGHFIVIQDFKSGLQYTADAFSGKCIETDPIPGHAGTVTSVGATTLSLGMKDPFELFFFANASSYIYVGKRYDHEIALDVWIAKKVRSTKDAHKKELIEKFVYELWLSTEQLNYNGFGLKTVNLPVYFKVYMTDNYDNRNVTIRKFHDYVLYDNISGIFWPKLNVFSCFEVTDYFIFQLNDTLKNVNAFGIDIVQRKLRHKLAELAGVSVLRIGSLELIPDDRLNVVNVTFAIARKSEKQGAKTEYYKNEIDIREALDQLNRTILAGDIIIDVKSMTGQHAAYSIRKDSLVRMVDFDGRPLIINVRKGYTGGSLATMAFFMLFIGGICGVFLSYVHLKRIRGGIAYQIYE